MPDSLTEFLTTPNGRNRQTTLLQVSGALCGSDPEAAIRRSAQFVLAWLAESKGLETEFPPAAENLEAFDLRPAADCEVIVNRDPMVWAMQFGEADTEVPSRRWTVEAAFWRGEGPALASVRVLCHGSERLADVVPSTPRFLRPIAEEIGLMVGADLLAATLRRVGKDFPVQQLVARIRDPERRLPLVVVSALDQSQLPRYLMDPLRLARALTGLAVVAALGFEDAFELTRALGKEWSVFLGAVRLYRPGADPDADSPFEHLLFLAPRLSSDEGCRAVEARLARESAAMGLQAEAGALPRFAQLRAMIQQLAMRRLPPGALPVEQEALWRQRIAALEADNETALAMAAEQQEQARAAREAAAEIRRENAALRARIEQLERRRPAALAEPAALELPSCYRELAEWAEQCFAGRLYLAAKARRAMASAVFRDLRLVCNALETLAIEYVEMRRSGAGRERFDQRLKELKLKDEAIAASPAQHENNPQYRCEYEGRQIFTDRHLKRGTSRDPRLSLRIYYGWDEDARMVVVGHLPSHLDTAIS